MGNANWVISGRKKAVAARRRGNQFGYLDAVRFLDGEHLSALLGCCDGHGRVGYLRFLGVSSVTVQQQAESSKLQFKRATYGFVWCTCRGGCGGCGGGGRRMVNGGQRKNERVRVDNLSSFV